MRRWLRWVWLVPVAAAVLWAGAAWLMPDPVEVVQPRRGPAVEAAYGTGTVEASVMLPIASRNTARLVALDADEGQRVMAGQALARLEAEDLRSSLRAAQAQAEQARLLHARNARLLEIGGIARQEFERSRAALQAASAEVARIQALVEFLTLRAPAAGEIIRRDGEIGQLIPANTPVFWLATDSPLRITAQVDEEDIARVKPGQKVLIRSDAFPDKVFEGLVDAITPMGDPRARAYRVRIALQENTPLVIGMTVETNIILREAPNALLIPASAVDGEAVWVVEDGMLDRRLVTIGARDAAQVEIRSGVDEDDRIVRGPSPELEEGAMVDAEPVEWP